MKWLVGSWTKLKHTGYQEEYRQIIATANCIKLKIPGLGEGDVKLTKREYNNTTAAINTGAYEDEILREN